MITALGLALFVLAVWGVTAFLLGMAAADRLGCGCPDNEDPLDGVPAECLSDVELSRRFDRRFNGEREWWA